MKASIFMTGRAKIKEQQEFPTWLENAIWGRVAGHISQKLQVRAGWLFFIGHDGTELAWPKNTTTISLRQRIENSVVLRMILDRKYCRYWNTSNAGAQARAWCHAQSAMAQESIQDIWGLNLIDKAFVKCMVRVANAEVAETLLRASGTEHAGNRWFIEGLTPDMTPMAMQWIPWNGQENWLEYGARCRIEADQQGLIRGRHQLGIKVLADTCPAVIRKWILEGFPKVAHVDDVRQCLDQNGFDEVEILEKSKKSTHTHCLDLQCQTR